MILGDNENGQKWSKMFKMCGKWFSGACHTSTDRSRSGEHVDPSPMSLGHFPDFWRIFEAPGHVPACGDMPRGLPRLVQTCLGLAETCSGMSGACIGLFRLVRALLVGQGGTRRVPPVSWGLGARGPGPGAWGSGARDRVLWVEGLHTNPRGTRWSKPHVPVYNVAYSEASRA